MQGFARKRGATWTAYWYSTDPVTGARRQHTKGGYRRKAEAEEFLTGVMPSVQAGTYRPDQSMTVAQLLEQWKAAKVSEGLRPGTTTMYGDVIDGWLVPNIGGLKLAQLSPKVAGELVEKLRSPAGSRLGRGALSDRSVGHAVAVLKGATRWAWESGLMGRDVLGGFKRPKADTHGRASSAWSPEEAGQFLAAISDDRLRAAWWLLLTRGPRRGEVCGLRWSDVDLAAGRIRIVSTRVVSNNKATESDPKTDAGRRSIDLDADLVAEFRAHETRQKEERLKAGEGWAGGVPGRSGYVFTDELGDPIRPQYVSRHWNTLIAKAGVRRIRLHDGRHSAATMLLNDGTPVHIVSKMLGHSKASITLDIYAHVIDGGGAEAGKRLTALLSSRAEGESEIAK